MHAQNARSNYAADRTSSFRHQGTEGLIPEGSPSVSDYVNQEKCKQMNKMRDWYLEAKSVQESAPAAARANFSSSRSLSSSPMHLLERYKGLLVGGSVAVTVLVGVIRLFAHF